MKKFCTRYSAVGYILSLASMSFHAAASSLFNLASEWFRFCLTHAAAHQSDSDLPPYRRAAARK